ncbi:MAG: hypothetical protein ACT4PW_12345 [Acidimicrobiia bacterium]
MKVLRPVRRASTVPVLLWIYRNRRPITQVARFGATVPARLRHGHLGELSLDARARLALLSHHGTRNSSVSVKSVDGRRVVLRGRLDDPELERGRRAIERLGDDVQVRVFSGAVDGPGHPGP